MPSRRGCAPFTCRTVRGQTPASELVEQVDDGLGLLTEQDPSDDSHVGAPVLDRFVDFARLDRAKQVGAGNGRLAGAYAAESPFVARLASVAVRATTSFSISATIVSVWLPAMLTSASWKRAFA